MRFVRGILLTLCLLLFALPAMGQDSVPSLNLTFNRQNDFTYFNLMNLDYPYKKNRYSFDLHFYQNTIYNSSLAKGNFAQLQVQTYLWQFFKVNEKLDLTSWLETDQFINTKTLRFNLYGGVRWKPHKSLVVVPLAGYTLDMRSGHLDPGLTPALKADHFQELPMGLFTQTSLFARYKSIQPRQQRNVSLTHLWGKSFDQSARLTAGVGAGSHEMDDYTGLNVKRILTDSLAPFLKWEYNLAKGLTWSSSNDFQTVRRRFDYVRLDSTYNRIDISRLPPDTSIAEYNNLAFQEIILNTQQELTWVAKKWDMRGNYEFQYYTRTYSLANSRMDIPVVYESELEQEKQKDFGKQLTRISWDGNFRPGRRHRFSTKMVNTYLRWDTPSESNNDDRDELSVFGSADWNARWTRQFYTQLGVSGNLRHYAFLFAERSTENYIQRFLRTDFNFGVDILPNLNLQGENAVYVTYNVKDFEDRNKTDRSTRNLETNAKLVWKPSKALELKLSVNRKEIHQSYLNWAAFTETTLDTNTIFTMEQTNRYYFNLRKKSLVLFVDLGYKHFNQTKRFPASMVSLTGTLEPIILRQINLQTGPVAGLGLRSRNQSTLNFSVWFQNHIRKYSVFPGEQLTVLSTAYQEKDLGQVTSELKPFVVLTLNLRFR